MKCSYHPDVETELRCSKCDKPICPDCMVQTPVGARCPDCARLDKLPTFRLSPKNYLIAAATALGMTIVCGAAWGIVRALIPFILLDIVAATGVGWAISEVVSRSVNRKRGTWLAVIGAVAIPVAYIASVPLNMLFNFDSGFQFLDLLSIAVGIFVAVIRLR